VNPVIVIEGQIGVGKTTMGELMEQQFQIPLYRELQRPETHALLDRFYADQRRWAFTLQIHFLNERFRMIKDIHARGGGFLDRSIFGDRIFAEVLHADGEMNEEEFLTYSTLLENMLEHAQSPDLLIYLDCSVDTALDRIRSRNRGLEAGIPKEYLERLNSRYLAWYEGYSLSPKIRIDLDRQNLNDSGQAADVMHEIRQLIGQTRYAENE
jgi:deoxyadenosine/deoxycytidine kinase